MAGANRRRHQPPRDSVKPRCSNQRNHALTLVETIILIVSLMILAVVLLPVLAASRRRGCRINCTNNVKQIGLAFRGWAGDNGDKFPMEVSVTHGGTMELAAKGDVVATFQIMSNELSTPKILVCPEDPVKNPAAAFSGLTAASISFFIGLDTGTNSPQALLSGDDNFAISGVPVKSGFLEISTNAPITWTAARHGNQGNLLFADGSVQSSSSPGLKSYLIQTGVATNRLAIP